MARAKLIVLLFGTLAFAGFAYWYLDLGHRGAEELPELEGLSIDRVWSQLGPPTDDYTCDDNYRIAQWRHTRYRIDIAFERKDGEWVSTGPYWVSNMVCFDRYRPLKDAKP